jgi:hypothetical protein
LALVVPADLARLLLTTMAERVVPGAQRKSVMASAPLEALLGALVVKVLFGITVVDGKLGLVAVAVGQLKTVAVVLRTQPVRSLRAWAVMQVRLRGGTPALAAPCLVSTVHRALMAVAAAVVIIPVQRRVAQVRLEARELVQVARLTKRVRRALLI